MDIDSANFDPKHYVLNMLKQNTIKELIRKNNEIEEEVKVHDQEIQSLVFENYSKFISSIDTVRQMKDNICMVDEKLKILDSSMDKISDLALKIDETFKFKRKEIQKLDTVNKDLQKLKNLCDFPNVLKQDLGEYKGTHESKISQGFSEGPKFFSKSIAVYEECYKTLEDLKSEPLIEPIYKESVNKIEEVRSVLRAKQVQFNKEHQNSNALRAITKSLIIISDEQNQNSVLRSYFSSWKERLIFKRKAQKSENRDKYEKTISLPDLINNSAIPEMNEEFWAEFLKEFSFIYEEIYNKISKNTEMGTLISGYAKEMFNWAVTNELEEIIQYSSSMKAYVHANYYIVRNLKEVLGKINGEDGIRSKLYIELSEKLTEKVQKLGINMLNFIFGRLKLSFIDQLCESKRSASEIVISEELLKEAYIKVLGPIKECFKNNFEPILNDLEHIQSSHDHIFSKAEDYEQAIHQQIESLIIFLAYSISLTSDSITEEIYTHINKSERLNKLEKGFIESIVKEFYDAKEKNGIWFAIAHNFLNYLHNQLGKKIIESAHKRIEISQNHNYGAVFIFIKDRFASNQLNLARFYTDRIEQNLSNDQIFINAKEFIEISNSIFPDNKRSILCKPSFLGEGKNHIHETELMTARKLRIIEKKLVIDRGNILTIFIRRLLKMILLQVKTRPANESTINTRLLYSVVQICFEIGNFEEESQISAFYELFIREVTKENISKEDLEESYAKSRKKYFEVSAS